MNTPYFLINENMLSKNIESFKNALNKYWTNNVVAYSIKTNSLPWILKYMKKKNILVESVSGEEYELAKLCGYKDDQIIFNGPIKNENEIKHAFDNNVIINIDSQRELEFIKKYKPKHNGNLGIRINVDSKIFQQEDIGYIDEGFRFGFSVENGQLEKVINVLKEIYGDKPFGLHLHCNSVTRSLNVYTTISKYVSEIIDDYQLKPSFIDIGGGFFGGVPGKTTADEYIQAIYEQLKDTVDIEQTKLIIEPGSALIGSVIDLYTSVVDTKKTNYSNIITTDGSRINIDPLWKKEKYMFSIDSNSKKLIEKKQIICGYTCMDHDRIMTIENTPMLEVGDKIIYHRVGAYTMTFGGPFIRYFPDVYVKIKDRIIQVRKRIQVKDYYNIHNFEREEL